MRLEGRELVKYIAKLAGNKKGTNILALDLRKINYITDYFVIISAESYVQVKAISGYIDEKLAEETVYPLHTEQDNGYNWVLLDYGDVVVHVFEQATREFYSLERLWGDAKFMEFKEKDGRKSKKQIKRDDRKQY